MEGIASEKKSNMNKKLIWKIISRKGWYLSMPNNKGNLRLGHFILTIPDFNILDNDKNKKNNGNN